MANFFGMIDFVVNSASIAYHSENLKALPTHPAFAAVTEKLVEVTNADLWCRDALDMVQEETNIEEMMDVIHDILYMAEINGYTVMKPLVDTLKELETEGDRLWDEIREDPEYAACFED